MIEKILWTLFYILSSIMILSYLFKEKKVTKFIDEKCERYIKVDKFKDLREKKYFQYIVYGILAIYLLIAYKINYAFDPVIQIKNKVLILTVGLLFFMQFSLILKRFYLHYNLILSTAMFFFAKNMFAIDDKYFTILIIYNFFTSLLLTLLSKDEIIKVSQRYINILYVFILVIFIQNAYIGNYAIPTGSMEKTIMVGDRIISNNIVYKYFKPSLGDIISFKEPLDNNVFYTKRITGLPGTLLKINESDNNIYLDGKKTNLNREYSVEGILKLFNNPEIYIPKRGDKLKLLMLIEFDIEKSKVREISKEEFFAYNISENEYKNVFGIWNYKTLDQVSNSVKEYTNKRFTFVLEDENHTGKIVLPILDFKYDKKVMEQLLNGEKITISDDYYMAMGDNTKNSNDSRFFGYVKRSRIYGRLLFRWYPFNRIGIVENEK